jgi:hypothetical protein
MEGEALREGKARVMRVLITPLVDAGMTRHGRMTVEQEQAMIERLVARLAYMSEGSLEALAEVVGSHARGRSRNAWPAELSICNWARRIEEPPATVSRLVRSMLQSASGDAAEAGGYLVELFRYLRKHGRPPTETYCYDLIRSQAEDNQRRRARIRADLERGAVRSSDQVWLQHYLADRERVLAIRRAKGGDA